MGFSFELTYSVCSTFWVDYLLKLKPFLFSDSDYMDTVVAERMNNLQKIVFSRTLKKVEWNNSVLINEVVPDEILKLKQQPGKDMSVGGSDLALTFIKHNLIDEYRILVCPVVLGKGKRLLEGLDTKLELQLVKTHTLSSGVTILYYHPK